MKASELIEKIKAEIEANGDNEVIFAANRHSYADVKVLTRESGMFFSLFDKIAD